jgi:hypothetical protein
VSCDSIRLTVACLGVEHGVATITAQSYPSCHGFEKEGRIGAAPPAFAGSAISTMVVSRAKYIPRWPSTAVRGTLPAIHMTLVILSGEEA